MAGKFRKFDEYLNDKGKTVEKAVVDPKADPKFSIPSAPEKGASEGKNWKTTAQVKDNPKPYSAPGTDPGQQKYEKGLGNDGEKNLIYEPSVTEPAKEGGKKIDSWPSASESFLNKTKDMTLSEFTSFLTDQNKVPAGNLPGYIPQVSSPKAGWYFPNPLQAIRYTSAIAMANENIMATLVRELKRNGGFDQLFKEVFQHAEAYNEFVQMMTDDKACRRLARAFAVNEIIAPPVSDTDEDLDKMPRDNSQLKPDGSPGTPQQAVKRKMPNQDMQQTMQGQPPLNMDPMQQQGQMPPLGNLPQNPQMGMRPEHNLLSALAGYKPMRDVMREITSETKQQ